MIVRGRLKRPRDKQRKTNRLTYLCLDYGIALSGQKGAAVHVRSICGALVRSGWKVGVVCVRLGGAAVPGFGAEEVPMPPDLRELQRSLRRTFGADLRLPPEVRQQTINRDARGYLTSAWKHRRPAAVLERLSLFGTAGVLAAREVGVPHALEVNALMSEEARAFRGLSDYDSAVRIEREVLTGTGHVFCVSEELRQAIIARGVEPGRVEVLPNGYDSRLFHPQTGASTRRALGLEKRFVVGLVGSLKPWHGLRVLLESFRRFASARRNPALLIVGDGPEASAIGDFQRENPQLEVVYAGAVAHEEVPRLIAAMDVAVAPYQIDGAFYFSPMKLYEYMAMKRPVVASGLGQVAELISDGRTGILCEPGDVDGFAEAFARLSRSAVLRERLGANARAAVARRTWDFNARRISTVLRGLGA